MPKTRPTATKAPQATLPRNVTLGCLIVHAGRTGSCCFKIPLETVATALSMTRTSRRVFAGKGRSRSDRLEATHAGARGVERGGEARERREGRRLERRGGGGGKERRKKRGGEEGRGGRKS